MQEVLAKIGLDIPSFFYLVKVVLVAIILLILERGRYFRSLRLYFWAKKLGLIYKYGDAPNFNLFKSITLKRNIITGNIGGLDIEFFDLFVLGRKFASNSILKVNGEIVNLYSFPRILSISDLSNKLVELRSLGIK